MGLFQQGLQSVLELHPVARQLVLGAHHGSPQTLLGIGHKAQDQLVSDQPLHQTFGVREIVLAPPPPSVRLRLRQMQRSRRRTGAFPLLAERLPVPLQGCPDGFPILCRRFHHRFFHLLLDQPGSQQSQLRGVAAELSPLKLVLAVHFHFRHHHRQHSLMYVDSCYPVRHKPPLRAKAESVPKVTLRRVTGYRRSPRRRPGRPIIRSTRTLRIRQLYGLNRSTALSISPLSTTAIIPRSHFHEFSWAAGPS